MTQEAPHGRGLPHRVGIDGRPAVVERRRCVGDLIVGRNNDRAIVSLSSARAGRPSCVKWAARLRRNSLPQSMSGSGKSEAALKSSLLTTASSFRPCKICCGEWGQKLVFPTLPLLWQRFWRADKMSWFESISPRAHIFSILHSPTFAGGEEKLNYRPCKMLDYRTPR